MSTIASHTPPNLSPQIAADLNTLPDPRAPSPSSTGFSTPKGGQHPDLSNEVAALSTKLINAINHQTNLDDSLQETRHELDAARERIAQLEADNKRHREAVSSGILVRRTDSAKVEERLQKSIADERRRRDNAERDRRSMETEVETLTSQLFEEANEMVASARHDKETADKRVEQIKAKLRETETLLASHQDQLQELKLVLSSVQSKPRDSIQSVSTAPVTPAMGLNDKITTKTFDLPHHRRNAHSLHNVQPPESPLHFSHLIHPVVRTDVQAYEDFISLLRTNRGGTSPSRVTSGSYVGLNVLGLGPKDMPSQSTVVPAQHPGPFNSSSRTPSAQNTPTVGTHSPNPSNENNNLPSSLKETKYYKRALIEDIEPTLRLDTAPGLSFLSRRTVLTSMTTGKLIVEPFPSRHAFHSPSFACSLCGEQRTSDDHLRKFRFRTSESDEAQRYPMCNYCLSRVRSTCDFLGFLREARKGNMRNETIDDCRVAWEECVRLRERMFWSRVGGGVVPAPGAESPMPNEFVYSEKASSTQASQSDSDLPNIQRADSSLSSASDKYERTRLSEVTTNEYHLPDDATGESRAAEAQLTRELRNSLDMDNAAGRLPSIPDLGPSPATSPVQTEAGTSYPEPMKSLDAASEPPSSSNEGKLELGPLPPALSANAKPLPPPSTQQELPQPPNPAPEQPQAHPPQSTTSQPPPTNPEPAQQNSPNQITPSPTHSPAPRPRTQNTNKIAALASRFQSPDPPSAPPLPHARPGSSPSRPSSSSSSFVQRPSTANANANANANASGNTGSRRGSPERGEGGQGGWKMPGAFG